MERAQLKEKARKQLGGKIFCEKWLFICLAIFLASLPQTLSSSVTSSFNGHRFTLYFGSGLFGVAGLVLSGALTYGLSRVLIINVRKQSIENIWNDLFCGFKEDFTATFLLNLLRGLFVFLWSLLLIVPGIIKMYSYSMAFYIQQDSQDKNWRHCLDKSKSIMDGHKMELFVLDLSFIGWYIVGALCFGVGVFFVMGYHYQTRANFYAELVADEQPEIQAEPQDKAEDKEISENTAEESEQ